METKMTKDEVIIVGGGPAGSALGCYLSKAGIKNTIFEGANHPRPHVGESMVMSSVRVFDEIGFLPVLEREGFPKKYGASGIRR
jgi:2-polyprenyl-6-methoxyphenol hydroxylase-like FAD-dependent oxidoreductase